MKKYLFLTLFAAFCSCTHYKSTDYEGSIVTDIVSNWISFLEQEFF